MIKARAWPAKAMYILVAAALAISLLIMVAPAQKVGAQDDIPDAEWERVPTPTTEGWVLAPGSYIIDYAVGDDGEVAYAIVRSDLDIGNGNGDGYHGPYYLLKSDDYAATWDDEITDKLVKALEHDFGEDPYFYLVRVACDPEDSDFVAVALEVGGASVHVYVSTDGGSTFKDTGEVEDDDSYFDWGWYVTDMAVSPADDDEHEIAVVGTNDYGEAAIFRCTTVGQFSTGWEDARYDGWDDDANFESDPDPMSFVVTDVKFAPSWLADRTILVTTLVDEGSDRYSVYLQTGTWGTTEGWNEQSVASIPPVLINPSPVRAPVCLATRMGMQDARGIAGLTLPLDYAGRYSNKRYAWVWVNWYDDLDNPVGTIFKVKDDKASPVGPMGQIEDGEVWLTNVDYLGYISEGKAIAGVMGTGSYEWDADPCYNYYDIFTDCCEGVQVYHNDGIVNMDICCEPWEEACKPPTGHKAMAVFYASDDPATSKAYGVALWSYYDDCGEGAWSVSFDDGDVWNQLSLIDTCISYLSDVAVSPDCNKTMLVSINDCGWYDGCWNCEECDCCCDSVWQHAVNLPEAEEYSGKWLRTWCGELESDWGLLRLAPEETTGDTVYLVDYGTEFVYWNELETLGCWEDGTATVDEIVDLAVKDRETIFALDGDGSVAMSDDFALGWHKPVDSELKEGYTIAVWGDHILVGGESGDVSYSDDGGETFTKLKDVANTGYVTVAFDSYFDTNHTIYAAVADAGSDNGVYSFIIDESEKWKDLRAEPTELALCCDDDDDRIEVHFTGLVVDTADGNPMTSAETGGVIYASYVYDDYNGYDGYLTGVARRLNPAEETVCPTCVEWDYLMEGLTDWSGTGDCPDIEERFYAVPDALKICGCLTPDSNSKLFAIDGDCYEMFPEYFDEDEAEGQDGAVWTFEDCYAKKAPDLLSPTDGETLPSDPCDCVPLPFTMRWDRLCDACSYDIQIALDEDFNEVIIDSRRMCDYMDAIDPCCHYYPPEGETPSAYFMDIWGEYRLLLCEETYYWRVRAADAATDQIIHSWWSEPFSFTIAPGPGTGVNLISPAAGATGVAVNDIPFSWSEVASADEYDWMLSANADMSSPIATAEGLTTASGKYSGTALDYETPHFWQVTALKDGVPISMSEIGTFTTRAEPQYCHPETGRCFDTPEELEQYSQDLQEQSMKTPMWVWVVIAIGAVLVIVVIVLIFRTRRV